METATVLVQYKDPQQPLKYINREFEVQLPDNFTDDLPGEATKEFARTQIESFYRLIYSWQPGEKLVSAKFDKIESQFKSSL